MKKLIFVLLMFFIVSVLAFSQFYLKPPDIEFNIDFGKDSLGILHYYGYSVNEFDFRTYTITGSIFYHLMNENELLIFPSITYIDDNTELHDSIKNIMKSKNITVCLTFYENEYGGRRYIINYSFDNYITFSFISVNTFNRN